MFQRYLNEGGYADFALKQTIKQGGVLITPVDSQKGYRSDTITQVSRLYAACIQKDAYLMTGDIDMIPLSDYWQPKEDEITIYGHDLTGYTQYPICYIGMPSNRWVEVMGLTSDDYNALIKRDLDLMPQAKDPDFYKYWFTDQELITKRIGQTEFKKTIINRGQYPNGLAKGRVDRANWDLNQLHSPYIDSHLLRDICKNAKNLNDTLALLYMIWPEEDFSWFVDYVFEFKKLAYG